MVDILLILRLVKNQIGKDDRKYAYGRTKAELEKKFIELKALYNKGIIIKDNNMTIEQLGELWFEQTQTPNEDSTQRRNRGILNNYIYPNLGYLYVRNLKTHHVQTMINSMLIDKTDTVRKTADIIKSMLELAVNNDWIGKNVAKSIKTPRFKSAEKKFLTIKEQEIIENSKHKHKDLFVFILYTGLRKGEIGALTWDNIDFENNVIHITNAISYVTNKGSKKGTKNDKNRDIPILDKTLEILERRAKNKESKYIFYKKDFDKLSDSAFRRRLESFLKETDIHFTLHQLRHTFCTILYYSGVSLKMAQEIMGHSEAKVTLDIYTHLDMEQEKNTAQLVNQYLNQRVSKRCQIS